MGERGDTDAKTFFTTQNTFKGSISVKDSCTASSYGSMDITSKSNSHRDVNHWGSEQERRGDGDQDDSQDSCSGRCMNDTISNTTSSETRSDPVDKNTTVSRSTLSSLPIDPLHLELGLSKSKVNDNDSETPLENPKELRFSEIPNRSKLTLIVMALANFGAGCAFSLPAPFFPREAAKKGASPTMTGLVFSSYELVTVIITPIFGNFVSEIGPKFLCVAGITAFGVSSVLFGFLDQGPGGLTFVTVALLVRSMEAVGMSAYETASFAIVSAEFPSHIASVFSILEIFLGIGMMVGPAVGGLLYELGGFGFPFWVIGALILSTGIVFLGWLPPPTECSSKKQGHILTLLRSPLVWVALLLTIVGCISVGFLSPTLAVHLQQFNLTTMEVSLYFVIPSLLYAILTPLTGYISDTWDIQAGIMIWACIACAAGFLMLGPTPLLPFLPKQLWLVTLGLILCSVGFGCVIIPAIQSIVTGARDLGLPDNISTYGMVIGLFNANYHLGALCGPTMAGALVELMGFEYSATVVAGSFVLTLFVISGFFGFRRYRRTRNTNSYTNLTSGNSKGTEL